MSELQTDRYIGRNTVKVDRVLEMNELPEKYNKSELSAGYKVKLVHNQ